MSWDAYINGYLINRTALGPDGKPIHQWGGVCSEAAIFGLDKNKPAIWAKSRGLTNFDTVSTVQVGGANVKIIEIQNLFSFITSQSGEVPPTGLFINKKKYQGT